MFRWCAWLSHCRCLIVATCRMIQLDIVVYLDENFNISLCHWFIVLVHAQLLELYLWLTSRRWLFPTFCRVGSNGGVLTLFCQRHTVHRFRLWSLAHLSAFTQFSHVWGANVNCKGIWKSWWLLFVEVLMIFCHFFKVSCLWMVVYGVTSRSVYWRGL